ncbi:MAG TPA: hypothetical protein VMT62_13470 [Syntrophorhabdaceae bacterium]|nr:hypothetical protein [Syntrophorhabdaceae bacterium]
MKRQKVSTPDFRDKLTSDMISKVEKICKEQGHNANSASVQRMVDAAIDNYVEDWYEVSLEAMQLMEGGADFVTDEQIDDPEVIREAKLRVIKSMFDDRPPGIHEHIAESVIQDMASEPH